MACMSWCAIVKCRNLSIPDVFLQQNRRSFPLTDHITLFQVNRMKAFSLQHRMNLMRQYKVKQRHLNKLLESFHDPHSPEAMRKHVRFCSCCLLTREIQEEEVRAALELPIAPITDEENSHPISRASSFYSLPEYVIDESGVLRPSPLVPTVRFTRELKAPPSSNPGGSKDD